MSEMITHNTGFTLRYNKYPMARLQRPFFARPTLTVAREILGKRLVKFESSGQRLSGNVVEVEAYIGATDMACHARHGRTQRNQMMYGRPGTAYVYFTYGMHWMLNFVTEHDGFPSAVLLRSVVPTEGMEIMRERRGCPDRQLTNGPAKATQAFGINGSQNGYDLCSPGALLFLEDRDELPQHFAATTRVGLGETPEPWLSMPWNYRLLDFI